MIIIDRPVKILLTPLPNYVNRHSASENGAHITIARYYRCTSGMPSIFRPLHDCSTSFSELLDQATNQAGNKKKRRKPQTKPTKEIKDKGDSTPRDGEEIGHERGAGVDAVRRERSAELAGVVRRSPPTGP